MITQERLQELLHYGEFSGTFTWLVTLNGRRAGTLAGGVHNGYHEIEIDGVTYPAAKLAWLYVHGEFPTWNVMTLNGDGTDCRIANLRAPNSVAGTGTAPDKSTDALARIQDLLNYDPTNGELTWAKAGSGRKLGQQAGTVWRGHRQIRIDGKNYQASQIAWTFIYGAFPEGTVRFVDDDGLNCRPDNLRLKLTAKAYRERAHEKNPSARGIYNRRANLKQYQGMTEVEYSEKLREQNGVCAICKQPETAFSKGVPRVLAVDHCHVTGGVRKLLCSNCNLMLGNAKDNPSALRAGADYLDEIAAASDNVVPLKKA